MIDKDLENNGLLMRQRGKGLLVVVQHSTAVLPGARPG